MMFLLSNMQILGGKHCTFLRGHEFTDAFNYLATGQRLFLSFFDHWRHFFFVPQLTISSS